MATQTSKKTTKTTKKTTSKAAAAATPKVRVVEATIPDEYTPIGMWGYFGYQFLFAIPVIGWILCASFALMAQNHNLRNFARSQFCWLIIWIVITCVLAGIGALTTILQAVGVI